MPRRGRPDSTLARTGRARERGARKRSLSEGVTSKLLAVHAHLDQGNGTAAAGLLDELAASARVRGDHEAAARFALRSFLARGSDPDVQDLAELEDTNVLAQTYARMLDDDDAARAQVAEALGLSSLPDAPPITRAARRRLPKKCLSCGAKAVVDNAIFTEGQPSCGFCGGEL